MKKSVVTIAALMCPIAMAAPIDFKGIPLGASAQEFSAAHPSYYCNATKTYCSTAAILSCKGHDFRSPGYAECERSVIAAQTYAGLPVESIGAFFRNDRLAIVTVSMMPAQFPRVVMSLTEKYGSPTSQETNVMTNRIGTKVEARTVIWRANGSVIRVLEYAGSLSSAKVEILSEDYETARAQEILDKVKKGAKDL